MAAPQADAAGAGGIQLPVWTKVLGWCGTAGLIYLLICAVSIISRGYAGLGGDAAHSMFAFAANPWVGLSVGVLGTVLIQSSTTTTAIAVTAVCAGALPIRGAIPIILGANVGTTVTTTLVALTSGKLLKLLMVGRARNILTKAVGRNAYLAMASGTAVTVLTQSSTITTSVLVPFAGTGILTPAQIYPVTVGANLGTTCTTLFAAFAVVGQDAKIGLQAAYVHLLYNVFAIIVIYVIPILRPVPLFCAETFARIAAERKWVIAVYLITVFIALPALVIILVGVL